MSRTQEREDELDLLRERLLDAEADAADMRKAAAEAAEALAAAEAALAQKEAELDTAAAYALELTRRVDAGEARPSQASPP